MRPRLTAGTVLRHDRHSGRWMLLGPERALELGDTAHAIVALCDGVRTEQDIADALALQFAAPAAKIATDVSQLLAQLRVRCLVEDA